jgi:hypothetical protein
MNDNKGNEDFNELYKNTIFALTSAVSAILRSVKDRNQRLEMLRKLNRTVEELEKVHEAALIREDYETCDVIKEFINEVNQTS